MHGQRLGDVLHGRDLTGGKTDAWRACKLLGHSVWAWPASLADWLAYFGLFEACKNGLKLGHNLGQKKKA